MRCPFCAHENSQVKDSRPTEDGSAIRRRRQCEDCGARFTTFERVQLRELTVVKSENRREPFDRSKLERSLSIALRKRPVAPERIERLLLATDMSVVAIAGATGFANANYLAKAFRRKRGVAPLEFRAAGRLTAGT